MTVKQALENTNIIYKSLLKLDKDCRAHFNDTDISNEEYFQWGLKLDLATNMMAFFLNDMLCGLGSPGIDLNARNILEAIAILECHKSGHLKKHNYDLYRESYLPIEYDNESVVFKWVVEHYPTSEIIKQRQKDLFGYYQKWTSFFGCNKKDLKSACRDSLFFLQKELSNHAKERGKNPFYPILPIRLINKYLGNTYGDYYQFLSILLHPSSFEETIINHLAEDRLKILTSVYLFGLDYLNKNNYLADNDMHSFEEDKQDKIINQNIQGALAEAKVLGKLNHATTHYLDKSVDWFYYRQIGSLISLIRDVEICRAFGFHEQAVIKFKIFIDSIATFAKVSGVQTKEEYAFMKRAFRLSTTYQLHEFYSRCADMDSPSPSDIDVPLVKLYGDFYKAKFPDLKVEDFIKGVKSDSLYFIYPDDEKKRNYRQVVKDYINMAFVDSSIRVSIYNLYQISLDIGHSSGYALNSSIRVWDQAPKEITYYMFLLLQIHFNYAKEYFKNKTNEISFPDKHLDLFNFFVEEKRQQFLSIINELKQK